MRWIVAAFAMALMLAGGWVCWVCIENFRGGNERNDETDMMLVLGGFAVLAGLTVLTAIAVTT